MKRKLSSVGVLILLAIVTFYLLGLAEKPGIEIVTSLSALVVVGLMSYISSKGYFKTSILFGLIVAVVAGYYVYFVVATGSPTFSEAEQFLLQNAVWSFVILILSFLGYKAYLGLKKS